MLRTPAGVSERMRGKPIRVALSGVERWNYFQLPLRVHEKQ